MKKFSETKLGKKFNSIFNWKEPESATSTPTSFKRTAPAVVDWTDSQAVNFALTYGLYHNSYPGMKLAGFGFNVINVPVTFMGLPIPVTENEESQKILIQIAEQMKDKMKDIHIQDHRDGTIWIMPKFVNGSGLIWEFIRDDTVSKIVKSLVTGEIIQINTSEEIKMSEANSDNEVNVTRERIYTKTRITVKYTGQVPKGLRDKSSRNPAGVLPIPFANNADGNESRGHSDYERIVSDLKNYHDIDLAESTYLSKFSPKMVQNVVDVDKWLSNNGFSSDGSDIDLNKIDVILNMPEESTTFEIPDKITASSQEKLKQTFHKLVELSGIPEIAWGLKTQGNMASVEENMAILMKYVQDKREQKVEAYKLLFEASLRLLSLARRVDPVDKILIKWDELNHLSEKTKSEVFKNFADGASKLTGSASWTKEQMHKMWLILYPSTTEKEYKDFETGLTQMVAHTVAANSSLESLLISQGRDPDTGE